MINTFNPFVVIHTKSTATGTVMSLPSITMLTPRNLLDGMLTS